MRDYVAAWSLMEDLQRYLDDCGDEDGRWQPTDELKWWYDYIQQHFATDADYSHIWDNPPDATVHESSDYPGEGTYAVVAWDVPPGDWDMGGGVLVREVGVCDPPPTYFIPDGLWNV